MMLYDYACTECGETLKDVQQSMKDDPLTKCPTCNNDSLERVIYGGLGSFVKGGEPTTMGQLAEKAYKEGYTHINDQQICKYEINTSVDMRELHEQRVHEQKARKAHNDKRKKEMKEINKMTPKQKDNYIKTGRKK